MSRRAHGTALAAAGIAAAVLVPLAGMASAAACPTWTDPAGDAALPVPGTADSQLDIVRTTVGSSGNDVVVAIKVSELTDVYSGPGDEFAVGMTVNGKTLSVFADRDEGVFADAGVYNTTDDVVVLGVAVTYDLATDTVTIKPTQAQFDEALGSAGKGKAATAVTTRTSYQVATSPNPAFDTSAVPAGTSIVIGTACTVTTGPAPTVSATPTASPTTSPTATPTPTASPTGSASPTPAPTATTGPPAGYPRAGCATFTDPTGDGTPFVEPPVAFPNEPDLDITAVAINTTPTDLVAYVKVAALGDKPANFQGDRFEVSFTTGGKEYTFAVGRISGDGGVTSNPNRGQVNGTTNAGLKVAGTFDKVNNTVLVKVDRAALSTVHGSAIGDGMTLTGVRAETIGLQPGLQFYADVAQATDAAQRTYTVGVSPCFEPPAAKLVNTGRTSVQFTDAAALATKLTDSAGAPLAGRTVRFAVGAKSVTAKTGSDGVAKASLNPGVVAGAYTLVTSFAGDATAGKVSLTAPFTVVAEKTRIVLTVAKSGTRRTVTARLVDDDGRAVAGQVVTFYVNGKKVSAPRTSSSGVVTLSTAKPTQTVKAVFASVAKKYVGSTAQIKV